MSTFSTDALHRRISLRQGNRGAAMGIEGEKPPFENGIGRQLILAATTAGCLDLIFAVAPSAAQDKVQLTFRQFDPPDRDRGLIAAVDAWNAAIPISRSNSRPSGGDTLAQLAREIPAGAGPMSSRWLSCGRAIWPVRTCCSISTHLIAEANAPGAGIEDFLALDLATLDGKIYGLPVVGGHILDGLSPGSPRGGRRRRLSRQLGRSEDSGRQSLSEGRGPVTASASPQAAHPTAACGRSPIIISGATARRCSTETSPGEWKVAVTPERHRWRR